MVNTYMFDEYVNLDSEGIPNNMFKWSPPPDGVWDIIRGSTPEHFLQVPFLESDTSYILITYRQGYNMVEKTKNDLTWKTVDDVTKIYYTLTQEETLTFKAIPNEPCKIQMRVLLKNGDIITSNMYEVNVLEVLDDKEIIENED